MNFIQKLEEKEMGYVAAAVVECCCDWREEPGKNKGLDKGKG